jgi:hypothetical protein
VGLRFTAQLSSSVPLVSNAVGVYLK